MDNANKCPSIYQGTFSNPFFVEQLILFIYSLIFLIGVVGNIMTIIIIKYNTHLRTPTNFYLLNLTVSDLMILMCNLPLEMLEIHHREWPLSIAFCKLRNISAEFFTCSSILTILAFTCERYVAIVHPVNFHRLSHFRRAQNIIIIIWFISLAFSLPIGFLYEIEKNPSNNTELIQMNYTDESLSNDCKSCVQKQSVEKLLSVIIIITSFCLFYFPMIIIGAIYLFICQALHRVSQYEVYSNPIEINTSSQSSKRRILQKLIHTTSYCDLGSSNKEAVEMQQQGSHINSYSWLKKRARCQARKVVIKTLVTVVSVYFVCYAPLYLQRLLLAIITLNSNFHSEFHLLSNFLAYLYVISGITFYFGSVINPILYNIVSNKYRRAFRDLVCCRLIHRRKLTKTTNQHLLQINRLQKQHVNYSVRQQQQQFLETNQSNNIKFYQDTNSKNTKQKITLTVPEKPNSRQKNKHLNLYH